MNDHKADAMLFSTKKFLTKRREYWWSMRVSGGETSVTMSSSKFYDDPKAANQDLIDVCRILFWSVGDIGVTIHRNE